MSDIKKIMMTAAANIKAVFGIPKANIKKIGSGGSFQPTGPGAFKDALEDISPPTYEFLFNDSNASRPGSDPARSTWPLNTGTEEEGGGAIYYHDGSFTGDGAMTTEALDGFDGYAQLGAAVTSRMSSIVTLTRADMCRTADRSWIYVWDSLDSSGGDAALETATTGHGDFHNWCIAWGEGNHTYANGSGHIFTSVVSTPNVVRIEHNGADVELSAGNGTHSGAGSAGGLLLDGGKRTVLIVTYTHSGTSTTIRWKQTGHESSGHTYITQASSADAGGANVNWAYIGSTGYYNWYPPVKNARHRYVGVVDHVITASEFDDLALAARVTDPDI